MSDPMAIASSLSTWHKGGVGASGKILVMPLQVVSYDLSSPAGNMLEVRGGEGEVR